MHFRKNVERIVCNNLYEVGKTLLTYRFFYAQSRKPFTRVLHMEICR